MERNENGNNGSNPPKTTVTNGGLLRKTVYFHPDEWAQIRRYCYTRDIKYTELIRRAVRKYLGQREFG